ncbi:MAG TPA: hypothetical protein VHA52_02235 [Candidatus Babeliaceae bacterium]|nr:hypothetical protein [Candidatus Babeliaceae bacterium]
MNIIRHAAPNIYDQAPYGTICEVIVDHQRVALYIQRSKDEDRPEWEKI